MSTYVSREVQDGLEMARKASLKRASRLRIVVGENMYRVLRMSDGGFVLDADTTPDLRGLVDLYDGARHLYQCLIVRSEKENGEIHYEFKRNTMVRDTAPLDFVRPDGAPIALLG
ncbi:hypothetical protein [Thalassobium sp. R2A62]|jgi:hypothetical protein|uniref:hypothetical protein n=1 Tax=Thalassobium sp. R2A62 TaxID=633131 RepID=UPI0001B1CC40|nr:hypothetical protein [Thalassobium sp. R2A62]EET46446.1 hypothetical protein TR2A62_2950 [Thalassobium sp. R2A62]MDG1340858.1 hypothetical protein [Paracoccaceae bacterium]MDG1803377.1 hypothetical protein [Paracoccaceae bacterium]MDG2454135.1 hypothetical protein [Paracoccaceae bacterium]